MGNELDLEHLKKLEVRATRAPWQYDGSYAIKIPVREWFEHITQYTHPDDGNFIVAFRNAFPAILEQIEAGKKAMSELAGAFCALEEFQFRNEVPGIDYWMHDPKTGTQKHILRADEVHGITEAVSEAMKQRMPFGEKILQRYYQHDHLIFQLKKLEEREAQWQKFAKFIEVEAVEVWANNELLNPESVMFNKALKLKPL